MVFYLDLRKFAFDDKNEKVQKIISTSSNNNGVEKYLEKMKIVFNSNTPNLISNFYAQKFPN